MKCLENNTHFKKKCHLDQAKREKKATQKPKTVKETKISEN